PIAVRYDGSAPASDHGYQVHIGPMNSDARGTVAITDRDPRTHPALRFNYLSSDQDRREWVGAIRLVRRILGQPAFDPFEGGELSPGSAVETDDEILTWVARDGETALHPSCTCAMGDAADPTAVVDPGSLGVHGIDGLRVIDASVFPSITNGNIYAPVMMVAEKAADLVLGNTPAPPAPARSPPARAVARRATCVARCPRPRIQRAGHTSTPTCRPPTRGAARGTRGRSPRRRTRSRTRRPTGDPAASRASPRGACGD